MIVYSGDDYETEFEAAVINIRQITQKPSDSEMLLLYGLYKQATVGENKTYKPVIFDFVRKAKWDAWKKQSKKGKLSCKKEYVRNVNKLFEKYCKEQIL